MSQAALYRARAEEAKAAANKAANYQTRLEFEELARQWLELAANAEAAEKPSSPKS